MDVFGVGSTVRLGTQVDKFTRVLGGGGCGAWGPHASRLQWGSGGLRTLGLVEWASKVKLFQSDYFPFWILYCRREDSTLRREDSDDVMRRTDVPLSWRRWRGPVRTGRGQGWEDWEGRSVRGGWSGRSPRSRLRWACTADRRRQRWGRGCAVACRHSEDGLGEDDPNSQLSRIVQITPRFEQLWDYGIKDSRNNPWLFLSIKTQNYRMTVPPSRLFKKLAQPWPHGATLILRTRY